MSLFSVRSFPDQFSFAHGALIDDLMAAMVTHFFPSSRFVQRAQAPNAEAGLPIEFTQLDARRFDCHGCLLQIRSNDIDQLVCALLAYRVALDIGTGHVRSQWSCLTRHCTVKIEPVSTDPIQVLSALSGGVSRCREAALTLVELRRILLNASRSVVKARFTGLA